MRRRRIASKCLFALALLAFCSGCAGYRTIPVNMDEPGSGASEDNDRTLHLGQAVRVNLVSGQQVSGELLALTSDSLTVGGPSNYGLKRVEISLHEVRSIEVEAMPGPLDFMLQALGISALVVGGFFLALVISCSNGGCLN